MRTPRLRDYHPDDRESYEAALDFIDDQQWTQERLERENKTDEKQEEEPKDAR
jgi:hypothetical protein